MEKITISADRAWIIRAVWTWPDVPGRTEVRYYETPSMWNKSPMEATVFQNYDSAVGHLNMFHQRDRAPKGWFDNRNEKFDIVVLYQEILQSPNGTTIIVK